MDFSIGKIAAVFSSRKLAMVLITLIIVFSIIGTYVPQQSQLKPDVYDKWKSTNPEQADIFEKLGFTHLYSSFIFLSIVALLVVNTLFCTKTMLKSAFRRLNAQQFQKKAYITGLENSSVIKTKKDSNSVISETGSLLKSAGYKVRQQDNCIVAEKNRFGILGTSLFHISILFIIIAVVYGSLGRMEGDMRLIEGQALEEEHGNYMFINEGPFFNENHQGFGISLEKFFPDYKDETNTPRGAAGELAVIENGRNVKTDIVFSNHMMTYKGYTFLGNVYGLAPLLLLKNPDGTVYSGSYITASDLDNSGRYVASFEMGNTGLDGGLMVYMTAPLTGKLMESEAEKTPILFLRVFDKGKQVYDGTLRLNETVKIADKYLGFYDIKYWSNFYVVKDDGTLLVYAGAGLMILSLMVSFFIIPKRIWVEVVRNSDAMEIYIGGRADKFRSLYEEEYSGIVDKMKRLHGTD
ncbi:MAG: cytochrome c biogenesis protein ResB [Candidatus Methanoperedens sp.]|nr:cytochrome c biogenesis protein ResB [Candidatus Methanoperedens sp.]